MEVRTRFAPSPTGFLHVGSARTALFAWLLARRHGGKFILRIEDTDKEREIEGAIGHIMESLRWLGIEWDEGPNIDGPHAPYVQSQRLALYKQYAEKLVKAGFAYPDPYTTEEIEAFRKKAEDEKRPFLFRDHRPESIRADGARAEWDGHAPLRFKAPFIKRYTWNDLVRGELSAGEEALDDFILIKADGYPTYNFCHIIDDIEMQVTHVLRGEEFIASTPKFLSLYDALEMPPPQFATLPAILGESGTKKLSKRDGAKDILEYRTEGYLPAAMVNFLALLGWNPGTEQELFSTDELIQQFDLTRVQKSGAMFNDEKLLFVNQQWLRTLPDATFISEGRLSEGLNETNAERLKKSVHLLKERAHTFSEARSMLTGELACLFSTPTISKDLLLQKEPAAQDGFTKKALQEFVPFIETLPATAEVEDIKLVLMPLADENPKEQGGRGALLWPLRYALSGEERSPDPFNLIYILGKEESLLRINAALAILD